MKEKGMGIGGGWGIGDGNGERMGDGARGRHCEEKGLSGRAIV